MKHRLHPIFSFVLLFAATSAFGQFRYISPTPESKINNKQTNIILKNGSYVQSSSLRSDLVSITGTKSGSHHARIILSDDKKTIVIYPDPIFQGGETVTVSIGNGFTKTDGTVILGTTFQFETHPDWTIHHEAGTRRSTGNIFGEYGDNTSESNGGVRGGGCILVPFEITATDSAYNADVFYYNFWNSNPTCWARSIISNQGDSVYAHFDNNQGLDFKINHNGYLTYHDATTKEWIMVDSSYNVVKTFQMGNGYKSDEHDFQIFPNGHCFMFALDTIPDQDLTVIGAGDSINVIQCVVQELDAGGDIVFQWISSQYFQYTDAMFWSQSQAQLIPPHGDWDWIHPNSIELDDDTTILLSSRHLSEVTKIDLFDGHIMWRWGGNNNQFTFINDDSDKFVLPPLHLDTFYFSGQHDVRRIANGHITMFNNDNNLGPNQSITPVLSDAKEYALDEVNKTATLVWHYYHPKVNGQNLNCQAMGSVQRLPNGHTFIDWGFQPAPNVAYPKMTEVDSLGNIVWEFRWTVSNISYAAYRAHKYVWKPCDLLADSTLTSDSITTHSADLSWGSNSKFSGYILQYKICGDTVWASVPLDSTHFKLEGLLMDTCYDWRLQSICPIYDDTSSYTTIHQFTTQDATGTTFQTSSIASFDVYPNPTSGETEAKFTMSRNQNIELILYNILGGIAMQEVIAAHAGVNQVKINLGKIASGIYTIELKADAHSSRRQLVVN